MDQKYTAKFGRIRIKQHEDMPSTRRFSLEESCDDLQSLKQTGSIKKEKDNRKQEIKVSTLSDQIKPQQQQSTKPVFSGSVDSTTKPKTFAQPLQPTSSPSLDSEATERTKNLIHYQKANNSPKEQSRISSDNNSVPTNLGKESVFNFLKIFQN